MKQPSHNFKPFIIEGFTGPMKSGKTRALLKRIDPLRFDPRNYTYIGIKPGVDDRDFNSRSFEDFIDWKFVGSSKQIPSLVKDFDIIAIDEVQFFDKEITKVLLDLQEQGKNIIFSGLDLDFRGEPFGPMPELIVIANELIKFHAVCTKCGNPAYYTQRLINGLPAEYSAPTVSIEGESEYVPRCYEHHAVPGKE
jgi:thymidine kinase